MIKNISRKKNAKEFLIYIENENSRIIERRKEEDAIKPFEMLNNIMLKNEWLNKYSKEERKDKAYNERIEMMDNLI